MPPVAGTTDQRHQRDTSHDGCLPKPDSFFLFNVTTRLHGPSMELISTLLTRDLLFVLDLLYREIRKNRILGNVRPSDSTARDKEPS